MCGGGNTVVGVGAYVPPTTAEGTYIHINGGIGFSGGEQRRRDKGEKIKGV